MIFTPCIQTVENDKLRYRRPCVIGQRSMNMTAERKRNSPCSVSSQKLKITAFNISSEANIVDPDQTAPTGAVWSGFTLFIYEASNSLVDDKNIHFVIVRVKG